MQAKETFEGLGTPHTVRVACLRLFRTAAKSPAIAAQALDVCWSCISDALPLPLADPLFACVEHLLLCVGSDVQAHVHRLVAVLTADSTPPGIRARAAAALNTATQTLACLVGPLSVTAVLGMLQEAAAAAQVPCHTLGVRLAAASDDTALLCHSLLHTLGNVLETSATSMPTADCRSVAETAMVVGVDSTDCSTQLACARVLMLAANASESGVRANGTGCGGDHTAMDVSPDAEGDAHALRQLSAELVTCALSCVLSSPTTPEGEAGEDAVEDRAVDNVLASIDAARDIMCQLVEDGGSALQANLEGMLLASIDHLAAGCRADGISSTITTSPSSPPPRRDTHAATLAHNDHHHHYQQQVCSRSRIARRVVQMMCNLLCTAASFSQADSDKASGGAGSVAASLLARFHQLHALATNSGASADADADGDGDGDGSACASSKGVASAWTCHTLSHVAPVLSLAAASVRVTAASLLSPDTAGAAAKGDAGLQPPAARSRLAAAWSHALQQNTPCTLWDVYCAARRAGVAGEHSVVAALLTHVRERVAGPTCRTPSAAWLAFAERVFACEAKVQALWARDRAGSAALAAASPALQQAAVALGECTSALPTSLHPHAGTFIRTFLAFRRGCVVFVCFCVCVWMCGCVFCVDVWMYTCFINLLD